MLDKGEDHIEYVCVGHCCHDMKGNEYELGGTAAYSAFVSNELGAETKIITAYGADFQFQQDILDAHIDLVNVGSKSTTIYENIYGKGAREQILHSRADRIAPHNIIPFITKTDIIHLCPIADEIDYEIINHLNCGLVGATIQGSLRCWDKKGKIYPCGMDWSQLKGIDVVIISDEDVIGLDQAIDHIKGMVPLIVVTMGKKGSRIINGDLSLFLPSFPIVQLRETGAGDTFAAAFFIHYYKHKEPLQACIYAHAVSSIVLERRNQDPFPTMEEIMERVDQYKKNRNN